MNQHTKQYQINRVWVKVLCIMAFLLMGHTTISASPHNKTQQPTKAAKFIKKVRSNITWRGSGMFAASVAVNGLAVILTNSYIAYSRYKLTILAKRALGSGGSTQSLSPPLTFMDFIFDVSYNWRSFLAVLGITALSWLVVKGVSWIVKQYGSHATHFLTQPWVEAIQVLLIGISMSCVLGYKVSPAILLPS